jgi:hypothetical protein
MFKKAARGRKLDQLRRDTEAFAALGAATGQNFLTVGRGHTGTEAMGLGAAGLAGLIGAFHNKKLGHMGKSGPPFTDSARPSQQDSAPLAAELTDQGSPA